MEGELSPRAREREPERAERRSGQRLSLAVVVPVLVEAGFLPSLFASLAELPPGERADELIVAVGGSRDASVELARAHGALVVPSARGRGAQLARGAAVARSELLLFLHADARVAPGALAALRAAFADPALIATGMKQRIDAPGLFYRCVEWAADRRTGRGRVYGDSALAVRRADYEAVGGFRALPIFEDLDLSRRLRRRGAIRLVREACITISPRRWERGGALRQTLRNWCLTLAFAAGVDPVRLARYYPPHSP